MSIKLKGVKQGRIIELADNPSILDDGQVIVEIEVAEANIDTKLQNMKKFLATPWDGQADFSKTMAEIDEERHLYRGRDDSHQRFIGIL